MKAATPPPPPWLGGEEFENGKIKKEYTIIAIKSFHGYNTISSLPS